MPYYNTSYYKAKEIYANKATCQEIIPALGPSPPKNYTKLDQNVWYFVSRFQFYIQWNRFQIYSQQKSKIQKSWKTCKNQDLRKK